MSTNAFMFYNRLDVCFLKKFRFTGTESRMMAESISAEVFASAKRVCACTAVTATNKIKDNRHPFNFVFILYY